MTPYVMTGIGRYTSLNLTMVSILHLLRPLILSASMRLRQTAWALLCILATRQCPKHSPMLITVPEHHRAATPVASPCDNLQTCTLSSHTERLSKACGMPFTTDCERRMTAFIGCSLPERTSVSQRSWLGSTRYPPPLHPMDFRSSCIPVNAGLYL